MRSRLTPSLYLFSTVDLGHRRCEDAVKWIRPYPTEQSCFTVLQGLSVGPSGRPNAAPLFCARGACLSWTISRLLTGYASHDTTQPVITVVRYFVAQLGQSGSRASAFTSKHLEVFAGSGNTNPVVPPHDSPVSRSGSSGPYNPQGVFTAHPKHRHEPSEILLRGFISVFAGLEINDLNILPSRKMQVIPDHLQSLALTQS